MSGNTPTWALTDSLDGRGRLNQALPGQLRSAQPDAQIAGPAFTVQGGCRDLDYAAQAGFPIWSGTITPQSDVCRWEIVDWNVPVEIGGVTVNPGDHVVADAAGIVVVPADLKDGVLEEVEGLQGLIANVLADVEGGDTLGVAFQKNISA
jgi:regulator of RNase E activity RraA